MALYMWETFTRQLIPTEKWDCIPRNPPLQFRHERQFPEVEAGFASADCRSEPARAVGAPAAPAGAAMHPWRNDVSRAGSAVARSEEHTSELQSRLHLVCRLLLEKKKKKKKKNNKTKKKKKTKKK